VTTTGILQALSKALARVPQNSHAWTYTIRGFDGSEYLTRTLLPRFAGYRPLLHQIHRADQDPHLHNHPWRTARFLVLSGGYVEERLVDGVLRVKPVRRGEVNSINASTFHRVVFVAPNTWTLGLVGDRCQDWGFLVDGAVVPHTEYFARKGYAGEGGLS
jgi:hypothetical protein